MTSPPPPGRPPRRPRSLLLVVLGVALFGFLGFSLLVALVTLAGSGRGGAGGGALGRDRIAVIPLSGLITAGGESSLLGGSSGGGEKTVELIRKAAKDKNVKAVVIRINSPGGSAAASQEIFEAILAAREATRKPFVASMADLAASGGYYVAAACDQIVANRSTLTGSIGVIMAGYDISGLLEWIRVKPATIKAGKWKDVGSLERPMTAAERALLQALINNTYDQFVKDVARGRRLPEAQVRKLAEGRVYTGEQAKQVRLVDSLGGFWDAVKLAQQLAKLPASAEPNLLRYGSGSLLDELLATSQARQSGALGALPAAALGGLPAPGTVPPIWYVCPVGAPRLTAH
ncbi:MAG: signal peptide peptidase SppA [Fimbriimonadaceae bacterium]|nr:signal peptide peptidase SppA [Fimbriimonadaceae bacterium]